MRRHVLAVVVVAGLVPSSGLAQRPGIAVAPGITHTPLPPSEPSPAVPAPPAPTPQSGGSHHGHGAPPPTVSGGDVFLAGPETYAPRYDQPQPTRRGRRPRTTTTQGVGVYYSPFVPLPVPEGTRRGSRPSGTQAIDGYLRLRVTPSTARVLVDSNFVGTVEEVGSRAGGLALEPGFHGVRIEAAGFETASFEVEIIAGEFVNYVRDLASLPASPAAPVRAAAPKTFYVIPGCYAGDALPREERLPEGCLVANLRAVPAALSRVESR